MALPMFAGHRHHGHHRDGLFLASLVKPVITYWVQYRPTPGGDENSYTVSAVYSHRMKWRGAVES